MSDSDIQIEQLKQLIEEHGNPPKHVAIIMDGNGRWAKQKGLSRFKGHEVGIKSVREIVNFAPELGVEVLTLYTFSKENWSRPKREISALMKLLVRTIEKELHELMKNNVRINAIGNLGDLPEAPRRSIESAIAKTTNNTGLELNLALSYSSRMEIVRAVQKIAQDVKQGLIVPDGISEETFSDYLDTRSLRDPDLLIRTGGESRLSNFLLWQAAYAEIYITSVPWPDFRKQAFAEAVLDYQQRERRFGMVSEQVNKKK